MLLALALAMAVLPPCDFTIRNKSDWAHVNDPGKRVICVAAAQTYRYEDVGIVQLSASGTPERPRWLRWANDNESVHPANVPAEQTAAVAQFDLTGSYWVLDRLVVRDAVYQPQVMGVGNILQRMVFEKPRRWEGRPTGLMLHFKNGSDNAVVDSVFREPFRARGIDSYAVFISEAERITVKGNEFIDLVNGVQNGPLAGGGNRFVENEFYHTSAAYTDCKGQLDPEGSCSCAEGMAVVAKGPADKPESFIERNLIWGFKRTDQFCAGSGTPGAVFDFGSWDGTPFTPQVTRYFTVRDNIIVASEPHAIYLGLIVEDLTIVGNYVSGADVGISNQYGKRIKVTGNTFHDNKVDYRSGPTAKDTIYEGNRRAANGELCVTTHHLTNPTKRCFPY